MHRADRTRNDSLGQSDFVFGVSRVEIMLVLAHAMRAQSQQPGHVQELDQQVAEEARGVACCAPSASWIMCVGDEPLSNHSLANPSK